jgi:hypothetical protein
MKDMEIGRYQDLKELSFNREVWRAARKQSTD